MKSFQILVQELTDMGVLEHSEETYFSLLFDNELPARVTYVPQKYIVIDFHLENFFWFKGLSRYTVIDILMHLNALGMYGQNFTVCLDNSDIILLSKSVDLGVSPEILLNEIAYLYRQATSIRDLLAIVSGAAPLSEIFSILEYIGKQEEG